jgi:hypothetical protein
MAASSVPVATRVMTRCDVGARDVFTGHRMRPTELAGLKACRTFRCTCCDGIHSWTADTAWCEERPRYN